MKGFLNERRSKDQAEIAIKDRDIIVKKGWFGTSSVQDAYIRIGRETRLNPVGSRCRQFSKYENILRKDGRHTPVNPEMGSR